jgi:hypothetical protein
MMTHTVAQNKLIKSVGFLTGHAGLNTNDAGEKMELFVYMIMNRKKVDSILLMNNMHTC